MPHTCFATGRRIYTNGFIAKVEINFWTIQFIRVQLLNSLFILTKHINYANKGKFIYKLEVYMYDHSYPMKPYFKENRWSIHQIYSLGRRHIFPFDTVTRSILLAVRFLWYFCYTLLLKKLKPSGIAVPLYHPYEVYSVYFLQPKGEGSIICNIHLVGVV